MSRKLCAIFLIFVSLLLVSCSSDSDLNSTAWPDDHDIATMIALTLTKRAEIGLQETPQPESQVAESGETAGVGEKESSGDDLSGDQVSSDVSAGNGGSEEGIPSPEGDAGNAEGVEGIEQSVERAGIPGFNVFDLIERLVGFGFDCPEPEEQVEPYIGKCIFETTDYQFAITIWGKTAESADLVEAAAFYFGDLDYTDLASVIFEMVAEMPYDGAVPDVAKEWVRSSLTEVLEIGEEAATEFGGVRYYLYALPSAQVLEIGQLQER